MRLPEESEDLPGARFGLRAWTTIARWDDVDFGRLVKGDE